MDSNPPFSRPSYCPECGASFPQTATYCWLCGWKIGNPVGIRPSQKGHAEVNPYASPALPSGEDLKWTYALSTLALWATLVAVVLGVWKMAPGLGIALGVLSFPAAMHTAGLAAYRKRRSGRPMTVPEKIGAFAASFAVFLLIAIAVIVAAIGALFVICMAKTTLAPSDGAVLLIYLAIGAVTLGGVSFVAYLLLRSLWRTKD